MRLFLAAPQDQSTERDIVRAVVDDVNAKSGVGVDDAKYLEVVDWHDTVKNLIQVPEAVALRNIGAQPDDIFVATSWLRFDQPEDAGGDQAVCCERDLELAYSFWKSLHQPRALFFSSMRLPPRLKDIDPRAFDRVGLFFRRFERPDKNRFGFFEFLTADELREALRTQLAELTQPPKAVEAPLADEEKTAPGTRAQLRGSTHFEKKMVPGKAYEVSFLRLEIADWSELVQVQDDSREKLRDVAASFLELVQSTAKNYGGEVFAWGARGGLLMFWSKRSFDHAIMTGLKVLHNLPVFNLDPQQNPLGRNISIQAAAHDAVIVFKLPIEEISSADINYVTALQSENTDSDELTITRRLLERIDERLRPHFKFKGRYEQEPIYSCQLPSSRSGAGKAGLEDIVARFERQTSLAKSLLHGSASSIDVSATDSLASALDEAYTVLNKFTQAFSSVDGKWTAEFVEQVATAAQQLRTGEHAMWTRLRQRMTEPALGSGIVRRLDALARAASRRRSRSVVILEKLEERCQQMLTSHKPVPPSDSKAEPAAVGEVIKADVIKAIDALVRADELDVETALTELLLHHKKDLLSYIAAARRDDQERHAKLADKLWQEADLLLLDDLFSIRGRRRADEAQILDVLVAPELDLPRFSIVRLALGVKEKPAEVTLGILFAEAGIQPTPQDLQVVWRCLTLGHADESVRAFSAMKLTLQSMWGVVSHPSIPVTAIYAIGERMAKAEGEDSKKIFFDCVRSRVEQAVENFRSRDELNLLTKLILQMLGFAFLVETGYFERFDDLLRRFLNRAQSVGLKVDYFERLRSTLEEARKESGDKGPAKPPAGIKSLPLTIQRRLAGEARYIYWFVTHPDPRIACETLRHIGLMHVERVLRLREINSSVLLAILRKPELFTRQQAILAALNHPKCTQDFANKYITSMTRSRQGRQALEKIAANPSASPVVRSTAKRAMANVARRTRR